MLLLLLGCMGSMHTAEGGDVIRGAVWFAGREGALNGTGIVGEGANTPFEVLVLLSNSALPCAPDDVADNPETGLDEAAAAEQYWQAQVLSAFTREGAMLTLLGLFTWSDALTGAYSMSTDGLSDHLELLETEPRVGFGAWMRVNEASVEESTGLFSSHTVTDLDYAAGANSGSDVDVAVRGLSAEQDDVTDGQVLTGTFDLQPAGVRGDFRAERCDNDTLFNAVIAQVVALQYQTGG